MTVRERLQAAIYYRYQRTSDGGEVTRLRRKLYELLRRDIPMRLDDLSLAQWKRIFRKAGLPRPYRMTSDRILLTAQMWVNRYGQPR